MNDKARPLEALVPHRPPMLLIDRVVRDEGDGALCEVTVRDGSLFVEDGQVEAAVFLEYMAQTAAVHAGLRSEGADVRGGYLLGARELVLFVDAVQVGTRLEVRATREGDDGVSALYLCEVRAPDAKLLATARLHVHRNASPRVNK